MGLGDQILLGSMALGWLRKSSSSSQADAPPAFTSVSLQTSTEGLVVPVVFGTVRLAGNIIWLANVHSYAQESSGGGKGGSGSDSTITGYIYTVSFVMGLCEGEVESIGQMWVGKKIYDDFDAYETKFDAFGSSVDFKPGSFTQEAWTHLTNHHPTQARTYRGTALIVSTDFVMGSTNNLPNLNFEVVRGCSLISGDANPAYMLLDIMDSPVYGFETDEGIISAITLDVDDYRVYCDVFELWISPAFTEQKTFIDHLKDICSMTNSEAIWHDGDTLKIVPYGDEAGTTVANDVEETYTPPAPAYDLTDDDFLGDETEDPGKIKRSAIADIINTASVEFIDRDNNYVIGSVDSKDQLSVSMLGVKNSSPYKFHHIKRREMAVTIADLLMQRGRYIRNTYTFKLSQKHCLLEPMDIVTLTDATLGMDQTPVRITRITENEEWDLDIEAEEFIQGVGSAVARSSQGNEGEETSSSADPGDTYDPVFFDPPEVLVDPVNDFAGTKWAPYVYDDFKEFWIALSGGDDWGGCVVYSVATDPYPLSINMGTQTGKSVYGELSATLASGSDPDETNTCSVDLDNSGGELTSVGEGGADALTSLSLIDDELIAFGTATLTGEYAYDLTYLRRGCFETSIASHSSAAQFIKLDSKIFKICYDPIVMDGKTNQYKFPSFNTAGSNSQKLTDVDAYDYTFPTLAVGYIGRTPNSTPPTNYLQCNGAAISRTIYADLFAVIGTTYGVGDGSTTFNLPNNATVGGRMSIIKYQLGA
ncbi:MAG: phage tail protein [Syntrophaceae bacterium]